MADNLTNLFWTGGWDSTFRLLQLLILEKRKVLPVYVIDPGRQSLQQELVAMSRIKRTVVERYPNAKSLLLPTKVVDLTDLQHDPETKASEEKLLQAKHLGAQYEWLAKATKQLGLDTAEIGIQNVYTISEKSGLIGLKHMVDFSEKPLRLDPRYEGTSEYNLFGRYTFPVLEIKKTDMLRIAEQEGFLDILEMSWFCHIPASGGKPCGVCTPCRDVRKYGMRHRLPLSADIRYCLSFLKIDVVGLIKKNDRLFNALRRLKRIVLK